MRRAFLNSALLAGGLFAAACTEQRAPLPTEGPRFDLSPLSCPPAASEIDAMITALFPSGDLLMSAQNFFNNIKGKVQKGDPASLAMAQSKTLKFVDFTIKNYRRGKLLDPNGSSPPTTQTAVVDLINALFCFSSFPTGTSITTDQLGLPGSSGGSAVIGSDGGRFTTGEAQPLAGLVVPAGAVSSDHLFAIARHDELTPPGQPSQCLGATNATVTQYPLCYSYSVFPPTDFAQEVILAVCQVEPPPPQPIRGRLRLAHPQPGRRLLVQGPEAAVEAWEMPDERQQARLAESVGVWIVGGQGVVVHAPEGPEEAVQDVGRWIDDRLLEPGAVPTIGHAHAAFRHVERQGSERGAGSLHVPVMPGITVRPTEERYSLPLGER